MLVSDGTRAYAPKAYPGGCAKGPTVLSVDLTTLTATQAVDGMRKSFFRSFGHGCVGRRLARAAWTPFRSALLDGDGIAVAMARAREAAENRNHKTLLVVRWTPSRMERVVRLAAQNAANTD